MGRLHRSFGAVEIAMNVVVPRLYLPLVRQSRRKSGFRRNLEEEEEGVRGPALRVWNRCRLLRVRHWSLLLRVRVRVRCQRRRLQRQTSPVKMKRTATRRRRHRTQDATLVLEWVLVL